ncbi:MAG: hypothetical protein AAGL96_14995 [Pseudomonadota bacterium]
MEWVFGVFALLLIAGVVLSVRQWRTGRGGLIDERVETPQTEADRERIRAEDATINRIGGSDSSLH